MITDGKKWHYLAVKRLSALLKGMASKNFGDFYCLNCFNTYTTENRLEKYKKVCENHDYCSVEMPGKHSKILNYNHGEKSMRSPFVIYYDKECLLEKIRTCHNYHGKSSTAKMNKHTSSGYSIFTRSSFDAKENKLDCYSGEDCTKKFCENLKEHVIRIINYEEKNDTINIKKNMKNKITVIYAWSNLVPMMTMTDDTDEAIVIIPKNTEALLIVFVI